MKARPLEFSRVDPADIGSVWAEIGPQVALALRRAGEDSQEVRDACAAGEAYLFLIESGFFVIKQIVEDDALKLFIWVASARGLHNIERYLPLIDRMAQTVGAVALQTLSARRGMGRALKGWRTVRRIGRCTQYEREVGYGG